MSYDLTREILYINELKTMGRSKLLTLYCVNQLFESETSVGNHLPQDQPQPITV